MVGAGISRYSRWGVRLVWLSAAMVAIWSLPYFRGPAEWIQDFDRFWFSSVILAVGILPTMGIGALLMIACAARNRQEHRTVIAVGQGIVCFVLANVAGFFASPIILEIGIHAAIRQARPVIDVLEGYKHAHGHYPGSMEEWTPPSIFPLPPLGPVRAKWAIGRCYVRAEEFQLAFQVEMPGFIHPLLVYHSSGNYNSIGHGPDIELWKHAEGWNWYGEM